MLCPARPRAARSDRARRARRAPAALPGVDRPRQLQDFWRSGATGNPPTPAASGASASSNTASFQLFETKNSDDTPNRKSDGMRETQHLIFPARDLTQAASLQPLTGRGAAVDLVNFRNSRARMRRQRPRDGCLRTRSLSPILIEASRHEAPQIAEPEENDERLGSSCSCRRGEVRAGSTGRLASACRRQIAPRP